MNLNPAALDQNFCVFFCFRTLARTHLPAKAMETPAIRQTKVKKILSMTVGNNSPERRKRRRQDMGKLCDSVTMSFILNYCI